MKVPPLCFCARKFVKHIAPSTPVLGTNPLREIEAPTHGLLLEITTPAWLSKEYSTGFFAGDHLASYHPHPPGLNFGEQTETIICLPFLLQNADHSSVFSACNFPMHFGAWLFYTWEKEYSQLVFFFQLSLGINMKKTINQLYTW